MSIGQMKISLNMKSCNFIVMIQRHNDEYT